MVLGDILVPWIESFEKMGEMQSSSINDINAKSTITNTISYQLAAKNAGTFTIWPVCAGSVCDKKIITVTVQTGSVNPSNTPINPNRIDTQTAKQIDDYVNNQADTTELNILVYGAIAVISALLVALYLWTNRKEKLPVLPQENRKADENTNRNAQTLRHILWRKYAIETNGLTLEEITSYETNDELKIKLQELMRLLQEKELWNKSVDETRIDDLFDIFI